MRMPMVDVREMRVAVGDRLMTVPVLVRLAPAPVGVVCVLMVRVVHVAMAVLQRLVRVQVRVALGQVEPDTYGHQCARGPEQ